MPTINKLKGLANNQTVQQGLETTQRIAVELFEKGKQHVEKAIREAGKNGAGKA